MNDYLIGGGAILTAGNEASIAPATLHAQADAALGDGIRAAVVDFESGMDGDVRRVVVVAAGWSRARFTAEVVPQLVRGGQCTLADVMAVLKRVTGAAEVHLFARWLPDATMLGELEASATPVVVQPLESLRQAALISGQQFTRWQPAFQAA
jgi:hypothetical protein